MSCQPLHRGRRAVRQGRRPMGWVREFRLLLGLVYNGLTIKPDILLHRKDRYYRPFLVSLVNSATAATATLPWGISSAGSYKKLVMHEGARRHGEHRSPSRISRKCWGLLSHSPITDNCRNRQGRYAAALRASSRPLCPLRINRPQPLLPLHRGPLLWLSGSPPSVLAARLSLCVYGARHALVAAFRSRVQLRARRPPCSPSSLRCPIA